MNEVATNPFAGNLPAAASRSGGSAVAQSDQQRTIAEVQAAMMIARMNPRDQIAAMDRIINACARPTLAEAAIYQYSRGGSDISGPSIRLAEAMAQCWGNLQFGIRELDQRNGESTVQAFAWDVETNTRREVTFQVPHLRYTKSGTKRLEDPRDVYEMIANQGARRLRSCILAVIPGDVTEAAVRQCDATMHAKADTSQEAVKKMVDAFAAYGVTKEQIEKRIQRRLDAITPAQIVGLKKVYASLRDGMSLPADWFEAGEQPMAGDAAPSTNRTESVKAKLRTAKKQEATTAEADPKDAELREVEQRATEAQEPAITYAQVADAIGKAQNLDALYTAADLIGEVEDAAQREELTALYKQRESEL